LNETDSNGGIEWDLTDKAGNQVSSGIYTFRATDTQTGEKSNFIKFAIVK
jgi:hypothetical protein